MEYKLSCLISLYQAHSEFQSRKESHSKNVVAVTDSDVGEAGYSSFTPKSESQQNNYQGYNSHNSTNYDARMSISLAVVNGENAGDRNGTKDIFDGHFDNSE